MQEFTEKDYEKIAKLMKPAGGGGTTVSCVAEYIEQHKLKAKAVVFLTDGYIEQSYKVPKAPCLWGVVDNQGFSPLKGSVVHISSVTM